MDKAFELNPLGDVPLSLIDPDPEQPRKTFDEEYIEQLAASIKADGLIQPIVLRTNPEQPGRFFIVAGENRWRASKKAKAKNIYAVLREVEGLHKLIVQLKENHQRRDLNPMEWALALQTMNKTHGLKQADIEKTLKESGVGNFGRAYISNMIRLLELPEWAQSHIRNNAITASHGKFLLQAMASEKVMEQLREEFEEDYHPSTAELQQDIYWKFQRSHTDLTGWQTSFDYREKCVKTGCQKMRKVSGSHHGDSTFCLDLECHAILQAEAKQEEKTQHREQQENDHSGESAPREVTFDDDNRVDINQQELQFHRDFIDLVAPHFDIKGCEDCKHRHIALIGTDTDRQQERDACFLPSCYNAKHDSASRAERLLKKHMTNMVSEKINANPMLAQRLFAWIAAYVPEGIKQFNDSEYIESGAMPWWEDDEDLHAILFKHGLLTVERFLEAAPEALLEIASYAITQLDHTQLIGLWRWLKLSIDDYRIDEHYLAEHTDEELRAMAEATSLAPGTYAEFIAALDEDLWKFIASHAELFGVPKEIRFAYERLTREDD